MKLDYLNEKKEPKVLAVWSPKPGDGVSMVAEAVTQMIWERRIEQESIIGLLDFNLRTPSIKYCLGLDKYNLLDDLLPFISANKLTTEILEKYTVDIFGNKGMQFVGGIKRPEIQGRYTERHYNILLDAASGLYNKVIIDAGNVPDQAGTVTALKRADYILTVMQPSFVSKECLKHCLRIFPSLGIEANRVGIVFNRYQSHDEEPEIMANGLNVEVLGTLNELDGEKNSFGCNWLWEDKTRKRVSNYRESLSSILEECGMLPQVEKKKKAKFFPRIFAKEA